MLPNPALKPVYDRVVWVYVYRDFTSQGPDRDAERVSWRFGVTSWPQLFLADPRTVAILEHTGREPDSFLAAVGRVSVEKDDSPEALEALLAAERRADELERTGSVRLARAGIDDDDMVVRTLALRILAQRAAKEVLARAPGLLRVPNDPFRYEVCDLLAAQKGTASPEIRAALEALVADPSGSLNPNVLRIHAVDALGACGDAGSVPAIAPFAGSGAWNNGLTGKAIDALASIARRERDARTAVRAALKAGYPDPALATDERSMRACVALAKRIHDALGEKGRFPDPYDAEARERLRRD